MAHAPHAPEPTVLIERLHPEAVLPRYMTEDAAGMDLCAVVPEGRAELEPGSRLLVGTGWAIALPSGYEAQVRPRSGLALRSGVTVLNSPGTIDADYRGEIRVLLINHGTEPFGVQTGDRIAQLLVAPVSRASWQEVEPGGLSATRRGPGGYGSTGV